jgi:DNA-directed RNA polymerase sigma subunit (sigma70/sigma32)
MHEFVGRQPTDEELASELDMPTDKVVRLKETSQAVASAGHPGRG